MAAIAVAGTVEAGERRFVYSYEANTYTPGSLELETWATWKTRADFDRIDFRHELEWGVTERFQLGFYFIDWRWQDGEGASYHDTAIEAIYNLTNPNTDWIGSSIYGEVKVGDEFFELESKLILQKNFGKLAVVYNAILEAEWEGDGLDEEKGEVGQTFGLSYMINPKFSTGFELLHEIGLDDWSDSTSALYVGPNASLRFGGAFITFAGLWQVSDVGGGPDFQLRTIFGFHF